MSGEFQTVIVSGGSRGLGMAFVEDLLRSGYRVCTFSRTKTEFIERVEKGPSADRFRWEAIDGTDFSAVDQFVSRVHDNFGPIYSVINNAGVAVDGVLTLTRAQDISKVLALNLEGAIRLARAGIKSMLLGGTGCIVNISSIIGQRGYSGLSVYSATKAGLDGFSRSLARELGERNIRVNSVAPGYLETEMSSTLGEAHRTQIVRRTPLGRLGRVEDVTGIVRFLLSDEARFITGQTMVVDGGIIS